MSVKRVKEAFSYDENGVPAVMRVGQLISTEHAAYSKEREHLFESVENAASRAVEQTSAAPGEQRILSSARGRRAPRSPGEE